MRTTVPLSTQDSVLCLYISVSQNQACPDTCKLCRHADLFKCKEGGWRYMCRHADLFMQGGWRQSAASSLLPAVQAVSAGSMASSRGDATGGQCALEPLIDDVLWMASGACSACRARLDAGPASCSRHGRRAPPQRGPTNALPASAHPIRTPPRILSHAPEIHKAPRLSYVSPRSGARSRRGRRAAGLRSPARGAQNHPRPNPAQQPVPRCER